MANIVLITNLTSHRAATYNETVLESFGHTVTLLADSALTATSQLTGYDLIACTRRTGNDTTKYVFIREANDAGIPLLISGVDEGNANNTTYTNGTANNLKITTNTRNIGTAGGAASQQLYLHNVAHPILAGVSGLPKVDSVYSAVSLQTYEYTGAHVGTLLASIDSTNLDRATIIAVEAGTDDLTSPTPVPFGARVVFLSWFYSINTVTYSADALTILENAVDWALAGGAHTSTGALVGQGSTVTGTATRSALPRDSTGVLVGQGSTVTGTATRTASAKTSTGVLVGQGSTVAGTATRTPASPLIVIDDAYEGSSVDIANSSVDGLNVYAKPRRSHVETIGIRWFHPKFRLTGVDGLIPIINILDYETGVLHLYPLASTKLWVYSYTNAPGSWAYLDNVTLNTVDNYVTLSHDTAFTGNVVYIARTQTMNLTQTGEAIAEIDTDHVFVVPSVTAAAFTPVATGDFPAPTFIAAEYAAKTDDLGRAVRETPYYKFRINDTSLMPTSGVKKRGILNAGIHAGEDLGEVHYWKYIRRLCSSWSVAQYLRRHIDWDCSPMLNAYGRFAGSQRGSFGVAAPTDANRNYSTVGTSLDLVSVTRPIFVADLEGNEENLIVVLDFHGSNDGQVNMFPGTGNALQAEYQARVDALFAGTVPDEGEPPAGSFVTYCQDTLGATLTMILEHADATPITEELSDDWIDANLEALYSMLVDGLIPNGDLPNTGANTYFYRKLMAG